jgi:hypothetical protein
MPTEHIVALLITERDRLNRAIEALEGPALKVSKARRGRPPLSATPAAPPVKKRKGMTAAKRRAQSLRMKAFWAARRKQKAKA